MTAEDRPFTGDGVLAGDRIVDVLVLGEVSVRAAGSSGVEACRGHAGRLLAVLASARPSPVSREALADALWGEGDRPATADSALRVHLSRLRRVLEPTSLMISRHGEALRLDGPLGATDLETASALLDAARAAHLDPAAGARVGLGLVTEALSMWRGEPFAPFTDEPAFVAASAHATRLHEAARDLENDLDLELGRYEEVAARLEDMLARDPLQERRWEQLMVARYRGGHVAEALEAYQRARRHLAEELGLDPGPRLVHLERDILERAEHLDADGARPVALRLVTDAPTEGSVAGPVPASLPGRRSRLALAPFVGRDAVLAELASFALGRAEPSVAVVEGAPGLGKTRLAEELVPAVVAGGGLVLAGSCSRDGIAGEPFDDVLAQALALQPGAELTPVDPDADALASAGPGPSARRLERVDAITRALQGLADRPALVVLDDVQWIGVDAARLAAHLIDHVPTVRWLVLTRPGERTGAAAELLGDLARGHPWWHRLAPFEPADLADLVAAVAPEDCVEAWTAVVVDRSDGNPYLAVELVRDLLQGGDADGVPTGVEQVVRGALARLPDEAVSVAAVLAVVARAVPEDAVARLAGLGPSAAQVVQAMVDAAVVVRRDGGVALAHDLVADAVLVTLPAPELARWEAAVGRFLATGSRADPPGALRLLVRARRGGVPVDDEELDAVAASGLARLLTAGEIEDARALGEDYLDRVAAAPASRSGLRARLFVALARMESGDVASGLALHDELLPVVRASGDPVLHADAVLSRGPVDTGRLQAEPLIDEAIVLLDALPVAEVRRRVQVACWAATHLFTAGRVEESRAMCDLAAAELGRRPARDLQGMVLGLTTFLDAEAGVTPAVRRRSFDRLTAFTHEGAPLNVEAMWRLLGLHQAATFGTLAEVEAAIGHLEAIGHRYPRPEVCWAPRAARAAVALARGDLDDAERLVDVALQDGLSRHVATALPVGIMQSFVLTWERGRIDDLRPMLAWTSTGGDSPFVLTASGLIAVADGDRQDADRWAEQLADRPELLRSAGPGWAAVAGLLGDIADGSGNERLAAKVLEEVGPHAGTELSMQGWLCMGSADRPLGLADAVLGDLDRAVERLESALADDRARGAAPWAARAAAGAAAVRRRRRRRGDVKAAALLAAEVDRLRGTTAGPEVRVG